MKAKTLFAALVAALFVAAPAIAQDSMPSEKPRDGQKDQEVRKDKDARKDKDGKKDKGPKKAKVGEVAPTFSGTDSNGNSVSLSELTQQGKIVVLQWFNPDCPYVVKHYENGANTFNDIHTKGASKDVVIIGVASSAPGKQGSGAERINKARSAWKIEYPIILDETGEIGKAYGAQNTPAMAVIGKDGKLAYFGAIDDDRGGEKPGKTNYVNKAIEELRDGKPVTTAETRAYGCSIKYKS